MISLWFVVVGASSRLNQQMQLESDSEGLVVSSLCYMGKYKQFSFVNERVTRFQPYITESFLLLFIYLLNRALIERNCVAHLGICSGSKKPVYFPIKMLNMNHIISYLQSQIFNVIFQVQSGEEG